MKVKSLLCDHFFHSVYQGDCHGNDGFPFGIQFSVDFGQFFTGKPNLAGDLFTDELFVFDFSPFINEPVDLKAISVWFDFSITRYGILKRQYTSYRQP